MKKFTGIIIAILLLMSVNPVAAYNQSIQPVGDRINLLDGDQTYPADTAFFIADSFYWETGDPIHPGRFDIKLAVDDHFVNEVSVQHLVMRGDDVNIVIIAWLYNFPDGMQGEHTFEMYFIVPCAIALEEGLTTACSNPGAPFQYLYVEAEVTFTTP
jgi:hypothetical protein